MCSNFKVQPKFNVQYSTFNLRHTSSPPLYSPQGKGKVPLVLSLTSSLVQSYLLSILMGCEVIKTDTPRARPRPHALSEAPHTNAFAPRMSQGISQVCDYDF